MWWGEGTQSNQDTSSNSFCYRDHVSYTFILTLEIRTLFPRVSRLERGSASAIKHSLCVIADQVFIIPHKGFINISNTVLQKREIGKKQNEFTVLPNQILCI